MEQFKRVKVVILPTNEATGDFSKERIYPCLLKYSWMFDEEEKGKLIFADSNIRTPTQLQHLYIISDDEIKEGDWYYDNVVLQIRQWKSFMIYNKLQHKKIIATTDTSLYREESCTGYTETRSRTFYSKKPLPKPSQQFIQKYIEEYNRGNIMTDVLVEYELISNEEYFLNTINPDENVPYFDENLKINPKYNTITIKKVKDSWNREEVIEFGNKVKEYCKDGWKPDSLHRVFFEWDKWIEENL